MKIVEQGYELLSDISPYGMYELMLIERAARICYQSEDKIEDQGISAQKLIKKLIEAGHEAMLEHSFLSVAFTCDRAVANELVRHRIASFAQESTRYCNYSKDKFDNEIKVIEPEYWDKDDKVNQVKGLAWYNACDQCEQSYMQMLEAGATPQEARDVLPLDLATRIVVSTNYREWRHIFKLRTAKDAHPRIRALLIPLLKDLKERIPVIFDDIEVEE